MEMRGRLLLINSHEMLHDEVLLVEWLAHTVITQSTAKACCR